MQVTETRNEGLRREFKVVVSADDISTKFDHRLQELGRSVRLPGFRPGKVPMPILKKRFGSSVMGEVLERAVTDSSSQAMSERGLKPALAPKVDITSFAEGADLEYTLAVELLPDIKPMNFADLELERLKVDVSDDEVQKTLERLAADHKQSRKIAAPRPAAKGDILVIDFVGAIDGQEFPGGAGKDHRLELGSGEFVAGFEDQLVGLGVGDKKDIKVTFPTAYVNPALAGKDAVFAIEVKEIHEAVSMALDDGLATAMGVDDLETLKKAVRERTAHDYARLSRARLKRQLLDRLAEKHGFAVPQGMVDLEFAAIWRNLEEERKRGDDPSLAGKSEDDIKDEFRAIAERRVRLGLLLSEVGRLNNIQVSQEEINRALVAEARRFPGQEKKVVEFYRNNPDALAQLRAPLFEDKVVDFILELAKVGERSVGVAELTREAEDAAAGISAGPATP
ncbi:MAG: trigger factor [Pseudomonadota bacterium]